MVQLTASLVFLLGALQSVSGSAIADPNYSKGGVCKSAQYSKYAELAYYEPAKQYCKKQYPATVTVTAKGHGYRRARTALPEPGYERPAGYAPAKPTKCYKGRKECLLSSVENGPKTAAKTICSCYGPQKTVTKTVYPPKYSTKTTKKCTTTTKSKTTESSTMKSSTTESRTTDSTTTESRTADSTTTESRTTVSTTTVSTTTESTTSVSTTTESTTTESTTSESSTMSDSSTTSDTTTAATTTTTPEITTTQSTTASTTDVTSTTASTTTSACPVQATGTGSKTYSIRCDVAFTGDIIPNPGLGGGITRRALLTPLEECQEDCDGRAACIALNSFEASGVNSCTLFSRVDNDLIDLPGNVAARVISTSTTTSTTASTTTESTTTMTTTEPSTTTTTAAATTTTTTTTAAATTTTTTTTGPATTEMTTTTTTISFTTTTTTSETPCISCGAAGQFAAATVLRTRDERSAKTCQDWCIEVPGCESILVLPRDASDAFGPNQCSQVAGQVQRVGPGAHRIFGRTCETD